MNKAAIRGFRRRCSRWALRHLRTRSCPPRLSRLKGSLHLRRSPRPLRRAYRAQHPDRPKRHRPHMQQGRRRERRKQRRRQQRTVAKDAHKTNRTTCFVLRRLQSVCQLSPATTRSRGTAGSPSSKTPNSRIRLRRWKPTAARRHGPWVKPAYSTARSRPKRCKAQR